MSYYQYIQDPVTGVTRSNVCITLNLFFIRIMKEHCIFLEIGFLQKDENLARQAREFQKGFESLLAQTIRLANNVVGKKSIESQQFVTPYTTRAERLTSYFTGIPIDSGLTEREIAIIPWSGKPVPAEINEELLALNESARKQTRQLADFNKQLIEGVAQCRIITANYPGEIQHMYNEAEHYLQDLSRVEKLEKAIVHGNLAEQMLFWNGIMGEHSRVLAGRLDLIEKNLIEKSRALAREFENLTDTKNEPILQVKDRSLEAVKQLQAYQTDALKGLMDCSVKGILYPLRMDHYIRETAHYAFILAAAAKMPQKMTRQV